jgi:hypothetical protein
VADKIEWCRGEVARDTEEVGGEVVHRQVVERTGALSDTPRVEQGDAMPGGQQRAANGFEVASPSTETRMTNDEPTFTGDVSGEMYVAIIDHHPHAREPSGASASMC